MNEGIWLRCDPMGGWSVVVFDAFGHIVRTLSGPVPTMEEAMRQFAMLAGNSVFMKVIDPQLGQARSDLYPPGLVPLKIG